MLESVTRFIFDNIGNQLSTKKIADTMTLDGRKISKNINFYMKIFQNYWKLQTKRYKIVPKTKINVTIANSYKRMILRKKFGGNTRDV